MNKLDAKYFEAKEARKKKGAGKGYKVTYSMVWREGMRPCDYLNELAETDRTAAGRLLCNAEFTDLMTDQWWNVPSYRAEHLRQYRSRITAIRKRYGMKSADVAEFMKVG